MSLNDIQLIPTPAASDIFNRTSFQPSQKQPRISKPISTVSSPSQPRGQFDQGTYESSDEDSREMEQTLPTLKLGDEGRAKLKSALSEAVRSDERIRHKVEAIGKIRLASMAQLLRMAKVAGLWEYAIMLSREHELNKRRSA
jgi:hypothetical protein